MTILITGGLGFVGSHLTDALVQEGHRVIIIDHAQKQKLRFLNSQAIVHRLPFADPKVRQILLDERPDVVVHLAAQISVTASIADPLGDAERNLIESIQFLSWVVEAGAKKIVFASSGGAIYGDHPLHPTPEIFDTQPLSPYGITKQSFEWYLSHVANEHGLTAVVLRFSNLYGPRQQVTKPLGEGGVIPLFLDRLLVTGEPLVIYGDGSATRDFLYIDDAVAALLKAIDSPVSGVVNVASGEAISVRGLVDLLLKIHGQDHPVVSAPYRPGEVEHSQLDPRAAKDFLHWQPQTTLAEGLQKTYAWYKQAFARSHALVRLIEEDIDQAVAILKNGGVIVFPTETSYGIGCDATNEAAVRKLLAIKQRPDDKGLPVILPPEAEASDFVVLSTAAQSLINEHWPGPLNIVAPRQPNSPISALCGRNGEQSVRKSSHAVASELARRLGKPLVASSANVAGNDPAYNPQVIPELFAVDNAPDAYLDAGVLPLAPASTTVRCVGNDIQVLRQGGVKLS